MLSCQWHLGLNYTCDMCRLTGIGHWPNSGQHFFRPYTNGSPARWNKDSQNLAGSEDHCISDSSGWISVSHSCQYILRISLIKCSSTIASALRFNQVIRVKLSPDFDPTFSIVPIAMWGVIEVTSAIVCVCLPMMRPILRFIVRGSAVPKPLQFSNPVSLSSPSMQSHHLLGSPQKALILRSPDPQETFDSGLSNKVSHCSDSPTTRQVETFVDNSWSEGRATSWAEFFEGGSWGNDISLSLSNKAMQQQKEGERTWMTFSDTDRGLSGRLSSDHNSRRGTGQYQV